MTIFAQNPSDALRYSRIYFGGTTRFQGMGGAFGSVGADFSVIATNPAGLGLFNKSEISITPSVWIANSKTQYNGTNESENRGNFNLGNVGFVFSISPYSKNKTGGFKTFNFAFGINRQNNFNSNMIIEGFNNRSSLMTDYINILNDQPGITDQMINQKYPFDIFSNSFTFCINSFVKLLSKL